MYCRNCGKEIDPKAYVCVHCGVQAGVGRNFCGNCGQAVAPEQMACIHCGAAIPNAAGAYTAPPQGAYPGYGNVGAYRVNKSRTAAGILGILVGALGIHNFYLGFTSRALVQLLVSVLTCGVGAIPMAIWGLVEGIMILTKQVNFDAQGLPLDD